MQTGPKSKCELVHSCTPISQLTVHYFKDIAIIYTLYYPGAFQTVTEMHPSPA